MKKLLIFVLLLIPSIALTDNKTPVNDKITYLQMQQEIQKMKEMQKVLICLMDVDYERLIEHSERVQVNEEIFIQLCSENKHDVAQKKLLDLAKAVNYCREMKKLHNCLLKVENLEIRKAMTPKFKIDTSLHICDTFNDQIK